MEKGLNQQYRESRLDPLAILKEDDILFMIQRYKISIDDLEKVNYHLEKKFNLCDPEGENMESIFQNIGSKKLLFLASKNFSNKTMVQKLLNEMIDEYKEIKKQLKEKNKKSKTIEKETIKYSERVKIFSRHEDYLKMKEKNTDKKSISYLKNFIESGEKKIRIISKSNPSENYKLSWDSQERNQNRFYRIKIFSEQVFYNPRLMQILSEDFFVVTY